jgi:hypothetical protein
MKLFPCYSLFFPMHVDVYYSVESQDDYGKMVKTWFFDRTEHCSIFSISDKSNDENFTFNSANKDIFFKLETMLYGRTQTDLRKSLSGEYYPLSSVLVKNIRGTEPEDSFFIETVGGYSGQPTIYEIKANQPYIGPFNKVDYFKIQLERSDIQGELVIC